MNAGQTRQTLTEAAYYRIEHLIIYGQVRPNSLVSEASFMERTGFGRTPVREALHRLARDKMIEVIPNKGVLIPDVGPEAELRILEIRRGMDPLGVRLACARCRPHEREQIELMAERLDRSDFALEDYAETVRQTHRLIIEAAHNDYLETVMAPLQNLSRRFWVSHVVDPRRETSAGARLHREMLLSILAGDAERGEVAAVALNDHLVDFTRRCMV